MAFTGMTYQEIEAQIAIIKKQMEFALADYAHFGHMNKNYFSCEVLVYYTEKHCFRVWSELTQYDVIPYFSIAFYRNKSGPYEYSSTTRHATLNDVCNTIATLMAGNL